MTSENLAERPEFPAIAASLLALLAAGEFDRFHEVLEPEFRALAMLPAGVFEWPDVTTMTSVFDQWFGDVTDYEVTEFAVARVGGQQHLRWRIAAGGGHLGAGHYVVEQQLYASTGVSGRIGSMSFLCSGFCRV